MARHVDESKRCQYLRPDGTRCNGFRIKDSLYCYPHSPKEIRMRRNIKYRLKQMEEKDGRNPK